MIDVSEEQYQGPEVMHKGRAKGRKLELKSKETEIILVV